MIFQINISALVWDRTNIRQEINDGLKAEGLAPRDMRGREVKGQQFNHETAKLWIDQYRSSGGNEYYISYENEKRDTLYGFVRLRLDDPYDKDYKDQFFDCLHNAALIRELHVYGELVEQDNKNTGLQTQHLGIGRFLMSTAEDIAWKNDFKRCAVIAGVGVRRFYRKLGYEMDDTYMLRNSNWDTTNYRTTSNFVGSQKVCHCSCTCTYTNFRS